jgi:S1-C subfamily serine protease
VSAPDKPDDEKPDDDKPDDGKPDDPDPSGSLPLAAEEPAPSTEEPSASMSMSMEGEEDEETMAGRAWRRATTIGPVMVDVAKDVAYALGPTSPYHRHDFIVIALAAVVVAAAAFGHRRMVEPTVEVFETRGLKFVRPATWLAPEEVPFLTPRLVAAEPPRPRAADAELPYHVVYTSTLDPDVRMEVRIEAAPTWRNIIAGLELDRRTRWGELYGADTSRVRTIAGHDWLRTRFRYAYAPVKGDEPRIGHAVELATVDRTRLYAVTLYGSSTRVAKLEEQIAPTLRVASHTGMPLVPQSSRLQPAYPASVARTFSSTVMVLVADLVDGRLRAVGGGSGVIVGADGSILTNHHVLDRTEDRLHDVFVIGRFVAIDQPPRLVCAGKPSASKLQPDVDLALLKCDTDLDGRPWAPASGGPTWPALVGAPRSDLSPGQRLWVLGYPDVGGGSLTILQGLVEGFTSEDGTLGKDYIKTDAALSHGSSGGPVVDDAGDLVGVATAQRRRIGNNGTMIKDGLVRPLAAAGPLLAIVRAGWVPREGRTSVEIEPTAIDAEAEGIRISTRVVDAANDQPIPGSLVMVLRPGVSADRVDVNRLDDMVIAWGRSGTSGEVFLRQPVPAPGTYTVMVVVDGYVPLIGTDALRLAEDTPAYFDPWGEVRLEAE